MDLAVAAYDDRDVFLALIASRQFTSNAIYSPTWAEICTFKMDVNWNHLQFATSSDYDELPLQSPTNSQQ